VALSSSGLNPNGIYIQKLHFTFSSLISQIDKKLMLALPGPNRAFRTTSIEYLQNHDQEQGKKPLYKAALCASSLHGWKYVCC